MHSQRLLTGRWGTSTERSVRDLVHQRLLPTVPAFHFWNSARSNFANASVPGRPSFSTVRRYAKAAMSIVSRPTSLILGSSINLVLACPCSHSVGSVGNDLLSGFVRVDSDGDRGEFPPPVLLFLVIVDFDCKVRHSRDLLVPRR